MPSARRTTAPTNKTAPNKATKKASAKPVKAASAKHPIKSESAKAAAKPATQVEPTATATASTETPQPVEAPPKDVSDILTAIDAYETEQTAQRGREAALAAAVADVKTGARRCDQLRKKVRKAAERQAAKRMRRQGKPRQASGFVKAGPISPEMAKFLGVDVGHLMSRTDVTKGLNAYVREHKLQNPENGRHINPDAPLRKLLRVKEDDELTYFNLQRFISIHFTPPLCPAAAK